MISAQNKTKNDELYIEIIAQTILYFCSGLNAKIWKHTPEF